MRPSASLSSLCPLVTTGVLLGTLLSAGAAPRNDHFAARENLEGRSSSVLAYDRLATIEGSEPDHGGYGAKRSLWWKWTAPYSGWADFSTYGSSGATVLAVYTGNLLADLSSVGVVGPGTLAPVHPRFRDDSLLVAVQEGETYQIAVAGLPDTAGISRRVVLSVNPLPTLVSASRAFGAEGHPFSFQLLATGGATGFSAENLPPGLVLHPLTGRISGTPSAGGEFETNVATTAPGGKTTSTLRFEIRPAPEAEPSFTGGRAATVGYVGSFMAASYYEVTPTSDFLYASAEGLPPGLTGPTPSNPSQSIVGTPTQAGIFHPRVTITRGGSSFSANATFTIFDQPPHALLSSNAGASGTVGTPFSYYFSTRQIDGLQDTPSIAVGTLPPGLSFNGSSIQGTPTTPGIFEVPVSATNARGSTEATLTLRITAPPSSEAPSPTGPPSIISPAGMFAAPGISFSAQIRATQSPTQFSATNLPPGLVLDVASGKVSGIPTKVGLFPAEVIASNAFGQSKATIMFAVQSAPPKILSAATAVGTVNKSFSYTLRVSRDGYYDGFQYLNTPTMVTSSNLPPGLSMMRDRDPGPWGEITYSIYGTPTSTGTFRCPVSATILGLTTNAVLTIVIAPSDNVAKALPVSNLPLNFSSLIGEVGRYSARFTNSPLQFNVASQSDGLRFEADTRMILGFPPNGLSGLTLEASNATGLTSSEIQFTTHPAFTYWTLFAPPANLFLPQNQPLFQRTDLLPDSSTPRVSSFNQKLEAVPVNVSLRGLPPGLYFDPRHQRIGSGSALMDPRLLRIQGTTTASGDYPVDFIASSVTGEVVTRSVIHLQTVAEGSSILPPTLGAVPLNAFGAVGSPFMLAVSAQGAGTVAAEGLPPGVILQTAAGSDDFFRTIEITGRPTQSGVFPTRLIFSEDGKSESAIVTIIVPEKPMPPTLDGLVAASGFTGEWFDYDFQFETSLGNGPTSATVGELPAGLSWNAETGRITGYPRVSGRFDVPFLLINAGGSTGGVITLVIRPGSTAPLLAGWDLASGGESDSVPTSVTAYANVPFRFALTMKGSAATLSAVDLPQGLELLPTHAGENPAWEIRGTVTEAGRFEVSLVVEKSGETFSYPLTLEVQDLDAIAPAPVSKPPRIVLDHSKKIVTKKPTATVRGRIVGDVTGTSLQVRIKGKSWQRLSVSRNGAFILRISRIPRAGTLVDLRATDLENRRSSVRVRIIRR